MVFAYEMAYKLHPKAELTRVDTRCVTARLAGRLVARSSSGTRRPSDPSQARRTGKARKEGGMDRIGQLRVNVERCERDLDREARDAQIVADTRNIPKSVAGEAGRVVLPAIAGGALGSVVLPGVGTALGAGAGMAVSVALNSWHDLGDHRGRDISQWVKVGKSQIDLAKHRLAHPDSDLETDVREDLLRAYHCMDHIKDPKFRDKECAEH
jgi:hypothetical protein